MIGCLFDPSPLFALSSGRNIGITDFEIFTLFPPQGVPDAQPAPGVSASVELEAVVNCIPWVEACGLVALCNYRAITRRLSLALLIEVCMCGDGQS